MAPIFFARGLYDLEAHPYPLHVLVSYALDTLLEHGAGCGGDKQRGIMGVVPD